jgi:response regulator RpfG family c-di-GMP phosphodiesterase
MNGIEMLGKMNAINPNASRILMSTYEIESELFQSCNCVDKFLQKPISMSKLINEVQMEIASFKTKNSPW